MRIRRVAVPGVVLVVMLLAGCQPPPYSWDRALVTEPAGRPTSTGSAASHAFSPDGTKLAFETSAGDLGPLDSNGSADIYVWDSTNDTITLISANASGTDSCAGGSSAPVFSPDGTKIAFGSVCTDLISPSIGPSPQIYVRDLTTSTTSLVTVNDDGGPSVGDPAGPGGYRFTADGTGVIFATTGSDLGPVDSNGTFDIYLRDLSVGPTRLLTSNATGTDSGNGTSQNPRVTPDGTTIVFPSSASDLGPRDTNGTFDVYARDISTGATTLVSVNAAGSDSGNAPSSGPILGPDGSRVLFASNASNLGPTDTNGVLDLYLRDLVAGTTSLISVNAAGTDSGNGPTTTTEFTSAVATAAVSTDGTQVAFSSDASDLVDNDTNQASDVFLRDLVAGTTSLISVNASGTDSGNSRSEVAAFNAAGTALAFVSTASDLGPLDTNNHSDIYVRDLVHAVTGLVSNDAAGTNAADGDSYEPVFASQGTRLAFLTTATNMGLPATAHLVDIVTATGRQADVSVTLDASPEPVSPGSELTYRIGIANGGPDAAINTTAALLLPEQTTFRTVTTTAGTCTPPAEDSPRLVQCNLGDLPTDAAATITITITPTVQTPLGTTLTAISATDSNTRDPARANNIATHDTPAIP